MTKTKIANIHFKAGNRKSSSHPSYQQIIKSGSLNYDNHKESDDIISVNIDSPTHIIIDCDKKTKQFTLRWYITPQNNIFLD